MTARTLLIIGIPVALIIAAYALLQPPAETSPSMASSESSAMVKKEDSMEQEIAPTHAQDEARYEDYRAGVVGNGSASVLFFHATWCPICKTADAQIRAIYQVGDAIITTYKVDYDTSADLKARYGVTYQHTFVKIDGQGNVIARLQGPTEAQLLAFLSE